MLVAAGSGTETMSIVIQDTISQFYGTFDGLTFCGARTLTLDGFDGFSSWLTLENGEYITVTSDSFTDEAATTDVTVTMTLDGYQYFEACEREFTASVTCEPGFPCDLANNDTGGGDDSNDSGGGDDSDDTEGGDEEDDTPVVETPTTSYTEPTCSDDNFYSGPIGDNAE